MRFMHLDVLPRALGTYGRTLLWIAVPAIVIAATSLSEPLQAQVYTGPLVVTDTNCPLAGCTFSGQSYESTDPDVAAITISTTHPVTITDCLIRSKGILISAPYVYRKPVDVRVLYTRGYALNPDVAGKLKGRFLQVVGFTNAKVEHCYMEGTAGIFLGNYAGDHSTTQTVSIRYNVARNIDGRYSSGVGTYRSGGLRGTDFELVQFTQLNNVKSLSNATIAWNDVINYPYQSRVEDNINMFNGSSGASTSDPLKIDHNYIQGAYSYKADVVQPTPYSGGGIMLADGIGNSSNVTASYNYVVNTGGYGMSIQSGDDNEFDYNHIISTGKLPNGKDIAGMSGDSGATIYTHASMNRAGAKGNTIGYQGSNTYWPDATPAPLVQRPLPTPTRPGDNILLSDSSITPALEQAQRGLWNNTVTATGTPVGPSSSTEQSNQVINHSFEFDSPTNPVPVPTNWSESGDVSASKAEVDPGAHGNFGSQDGTYHGTHYSSSTYNVTTYEYPPNVTPGFYTAKVWVRSGGGQTTCRFVVSDYGNDQPGSAGVPQPDLYVDIPTTGDSGGWKQLVIPYIPVTTTHCKVALYSDSPGGKWMYFDNVELRKQ